MRSKWLVSWLGLFLLLLVASTARAEDAPVLIQNEPILSLKRLSLAVGADYAWWSGEQSNQPSFDKEWQAGFYGAYSLTPHLAAIGRVEYGLDSKLFHSALGIRLTVFKGN